MPNHPTATDAPFDLAADRASWIYLEGEPVSIVFRSRRRIVVDVAGTRHRLCRRRLERDGIDHVDDLAFTVSHYLRKDIA